MKKLLTSVFGLALLVAAIVPFTNASRDAYHTYLYQQTRRRTPQDTPGYPYRPFSERIGTTKRLLQPVSTSNRPGKIRIRNLRYSQPKTRNAYSKPSSIENQRAYQRPLRPSTRRLALPWRERMQKRGTVIFKKIQDAVEEFETYENSTFSIQVPKNWFPSAGQPHFFRSRESDFTISITKIEDACENVSFTTCAIALSKDRNSETPMHKIINVSAISRQAQYSDTVLDQPNIQTRTFTESFSGQIRDEQKYITRYFVATPEGGVYLIETETSLRNAPRYIGVSKKIFDSFRLFPSETE
jgi:hypothetical protein